MGGGCFRRDETLEPVWEHLSWKGREIRLREGDRRRPVVRKIIRKIRRFGSLALLEGLPLNPPRGTLPQQIRSSLAGQKPPRHGRAGAESGSRSRISRRTDAR